MSSDQGDRRDASAEFLVAARPAVRRALLQYLPIVGWLPRYDRSWLPFDLLAGLTSWGVMVPVSLAYAELAGMPPEVGVITSLMAMTAYALLGTSRHLKVASTSTMAVMSASVVAPIALGDPGRFVGLTVTLTLIVGVLLLAAGLLRLGFLADFLTKPVVTGFIVGVSITILVGQLPKLFGVPSTRGTILDEVVGFIQQLPDTNVTSLALGVGALLLMIISRRIDVRIPGPLVALVVAVALVKVFDLTTHGVAVVGPVATGIPTPSLPGFPRGDLVVLLTGAAAMVFLALAESIGAGRAFANRHGYRIDADQELVAMGAANLASGLFGGFSIDASVSQTATAEAAGSRSQLASLVTAALLLATALVLAPLFEDVPQSVLAAIVIAGVLRLINTKELQRYVRYRRRDFWLAMTALVGVVATGVLLGILIAALLSIVALLYRASQPAIATLGRLPGPDDVFGDMSRHPNATALPPVLILRLDTPLYYFNANAVSTQVLDLIDRSQPPPRAVVLDMAATNELDVTTGDMLMELLTALGERRTSLWLAQPRGPVRDRMQTTGLQAAIGADHLLPTVPAAVRAAIRETTKPDETAAADDAPDTGGTMAST